MGEKLRKYTFAIMLVFLLSLVIDSFWTDSNLFYQEAVAPEREFQENVTIPANDFSVLNLQFQQGDELELIFSLEVKQQGRVIDVWFVNYANYVRLVDGNEFLFFIDGSGQEISKASKIVSVTQHDAYALVLANYNNVSAEVYLTYDINVYPEEIEPAPITGKVVDESGDPIEGAIVQLKNSAGGIVATYTTDSSGDFEFIDIPSGSYNITVFADGFKESNMISATISSGAPTVDVGNIELTVISEPTEETSIPLWKEPYIMLPIGLIIGIIVGMLLYRVSGRSRKMAPEVAAKAISKKTSKTKKKETKAVTKAPEKKKVKVRRATKAEPETKKDEPKVDEKEPSPSFCGHCGKPVETPFCPYCGKEAGKA